MASDPVGRKDDREGWLRVGLGLRPLPHRARADPGSDIRSLDVDGGSGCRDRTVRLGQMCTCNGYRPPAYLAKVAASIDAISGGRLEMGIGAGWYEHEYNGYGYPFPKASVRIGELGEAVEIMRRMWTEDEASFDGKYYKLDGAICQPKPVQKPHIPFWIAGGGEKLTLNVAARYASYTNFGQHG